MFADVLLPLPLTGYFTYNVPDEFASGLMVGCRVVVPFGRSKYYTAIVTSLHEQKPKEYEVKAIASVLDEKPILIRPQLKLWEWISQYYMCSMGEVYKAALPSGLKLESETVIAINTEFEEDEEKRLQERERILLMTLSSKERMSISELEKESGLRNILSPIKRLLEMEAIQISEEIKQRFRPKTETYVKLTEQYNQQEQLRTLFAELKRSPKQLHCLMCYLDISRHLNKREQREVSKRELIERSKISPAVLTSLIEKQVLFCYKKIVKRVSDQTSTSNTNIPILSPKQQEAYNQLNDSLLKADIALLHGVTGSGKTEIYIHLIEQALRLKRQALFMVPEIALTTQLADRLQQVFGDDLAVYHSRFSDNERAEIWTQMLEETPPKVILGVRSSLFLPFKDLGVVIVDEEHETSYKQQDPSPRYHARNTAMMLARMHGAKTILGSATPSIESFYNAQEGRYGYISLNTRFSEVLPPQIIIADLKELRRKKQMTGEFSPLLLELISNTRKEGKQVILFQNRRGFSPITECKLCAWVPKCKHCDVSLTYHKKHKRLECHYCGYAITPPTICPACGSTSLEFQGAGTERIEEELSSTLPNESIVRMDLDTTRNRRAFGQLINDFQNKKYGILIGTQMVSKGLDFDNVHLVGILNADQMLNQPDFRAHEKAFQMMTQVAGRAGRRQKQGEVLIQTAQVEHSIIRQVASNDYLGMYSKQLEERKIFKYPPFFRLIYIYLKHRQGDRLEALAHNYAERLRSTFHERVLGPEEPPISRIQEVYIRRIVLKLENHASINEVRELLINIQQCLTNEDRFKGTSIYYDVDPA